MSSVFMLVALFFVGFVSVVIASRAGEVGPEVQPEVQLPDAFGFNNTGVFAVTDESEFGPQSHKHEAAITWSLSSEFAEKHPHLESTFEKIKTYAFSYPSPEHEYGAWLYHGEAQGKSKKGKKGKSKKGKSKKGKKALVASRPIGALVNKQPADEWFVKKWSGQVLVDTEDQPLVDTDGKNKICEMKSEGWFVDQYQDVAEYCWAPNCLMLENNGTLNGGCLVFKMKGSTVGWTAYVWSLQKSTADTQKEKTPVQAETETPEKAAETPEKTPEKAADTQQAETETAAAKKRADDEAAAAKKKAAAAKKRAHDEAAAAKKKAAAAKKRADDEAAAAKKKADDEAAARKKYFELHFLKPAAKAAAAKLAADNLAASKKKAADDAAAAAAAKKKAAAAKKRADDEAAAAKKRAHIYEAAAAKRKAAAAKERADDEAAAAKKKADDEAITTTTTTTETPETETRGTKRKKSLQPAYGEGERNRWVASEESSD